MHIHVQMFYLDRQAYNIFGAMRDACARDKERERRERAVIFVCKHTRGCLYQNENCHCVFCNTHHRMSPEPKKKENEKKNINILIITDAE